MFFFFYVAMSMGFNAILIGELSFIRTKRQTSSRSKRLFLVFDFSPLVLYTLGHKNNNNNNNSNNNNNNENYLYGVVFLVLDY